MNASGPRARKPPGFPDRSAALIAREQTLIETITRLYHDWGFVALDTGALEYADALGTYLPDTDRPGGGVFSLPGDHHTCPLSLRYDHTAPLARYVAQNRAQMSFPFRRYAAGPVWRNEKPDPGRFCQFNQVDADSVGATAPLADAQMIAMASQAMTEAGCQKRSCIHINSRCLLDAVLARSGAPAEALPAVLRAIDKLDRLGIEAVEALLSDGRRDQSGDFTEGAGLSPSGVETCLRFVSAGRDSRSATIDVLSDLVGDTQIGAGGVEDLSAIDAIIGGCGIDEDQVRIDPSVVRGLAYYTGVVFEAVLSGGAVTGSVGGGGRYDGLVARFGGAPIPATGFSLGVTRLALALGQEEETVESGPVVVLVLDRSLYTAYAALAVQIRRGGLRAEVYEGTGGMRAQMKYADRRNCPAVVIVGGDEIASDTVTIKDLRAGARASGQIADNRTWRSERPGQVSVPRGDLVTALRCCIGGDEA